MAELLIQSAEGDQRRFPLTEARVTIGRSRESDVFLPDQWLSRQHAEIRLREGAHFLADLGSKNGTLLNGSQVTSERRLSDGDVIKLGEQSLTYRLVAAEEEEEEPEPLGTQIFSAKELSEVPTRSVEDPADLIRQNRLLVLLSRTAEALLVHRPLPQVFEKVLDLLMDAVPAERAAILMLEGPTRKPTIKASRSRHGALITSVSRTIARRVIAERISVLLPNVLEDASLKAQESILASGIRSAVCAPLLYSAEPSDREGSADRSDEVIGLVYLDSLLGKHSFTEEDARIVTALAHVAAAKIENAYLIEDSLVKRRLEEDMRVAAEVQRSLLPAAAPEIAGWSLKGSNRPCRTVGGDYFDFGSAGPDVLLTLGDVSGKGTGAALLITALRTAVRAHWTEAPLGDAVARINHTVCENVPEGKYITFFIARFDPTSGVLSYVNAGHNPPLLVRADGRVETLTEGGMVLGLLDSVPYADGQVQLGPGDVLVIYSDGVTETWNAADQEFGEEGLTGLVTGCRHLDAPALESRILEELEVFAAGTGATDDRTLVVLKRE